MDKESQYKEYKILSGQAKKKQQKKPQWDSGFIEPHKHSVKRYLDCIKI